MAEMKGSIGTVAVSVEVDLKPSEQFDAVAKILVYVKERSTQDVTEAWCDWGANVFNDESLDDFGRFEKVYQICQEIVEPIKRTCRYVWDEKRHAWVCDQCGGIEPASNDVSYCCDCGAEVIG